MRRVVVFSVVSVGCVKCNIHDNVRNRRKARYELSSTFRGISQDDTGRKQNGGRRMTDPKGDRSKQA